MTRLAVLLPVGLLFAACGPSEKCVGGTVSGVSLKQDGASIAVDPQICARETRQDNGYMYLQVDLYVGTFGSLGVEVSKTGEWGNAVCGDGVSVRFEDGPTNHLDYVDNGAWTADFQSTPPTSCSITSRLAGANDEGAFAGHLRRLKLDGVTAEYLDVAFSYTVKR